MCVCCIAVNNNLSHSQPGIGGGNRRVRGVSAAVCAFCDRRPLDPTQHSEHTTLSAYIIVFFLNRFHHRWCAVAQTTDHVHVFTFVYRSLCRSGYHYTHIHYTLAGFFVYLVTVEVVACGTHLFAFIRNRIYTRTPLCIYKHATARMPYY